MDKEAQPLAGRNDGRNPILNGALETAVQFQQLMMLYESAIRQITTKLEILKHEFYVKGLHEPIDSVRSRVKSPVSIARKLQRRNLELTFRNITDEIHDVAGVRVICPYISDVYTVARLLENQSDLTVLETRDYIQRPKESGYRSLHLIAEVPVCLSDATENVKAELQLRTISMDSWATLEHELRYKSPEAASIPPEVADDLHACAEKMHEADMEMERIARLVTPGKYEYDRLDIMKYL